MTAFRPRLHVVPHVHWDREGYRTQPEFGERLGPLLDDVLTRLERGELPHLLLDGQLAVVEDWLAQTPEAERGTQRARITRLVQAGKLALGPWFVLADQALVGAELHEWNLRLGLELGDALGGAQRVGYLPASFGLLAGMPSLLRRFGIDTAVVWRGIPAGHTHPFFRWVAPDGAEVTAAWLPWGYLQGPCDLRDEAAVRACLDQLVAGHGEHPEDVLLLCGGDHRPPDRRLGERMALLSERADLGDTNLAAFLGRARAAATLPELRGELRDPRQVRILPGTLSARIHLKQRQAECEHLLFRELLPLLGRDHFRTVPHARFARLVRTLLLNAPHDSLGGCAVDAVHRAMDVRYDEVEGVGRFLRDRTLAALAGRAGEAVAGPTAELAVFSTHAAPGPNELTCDLVTTAATGIAVVGGSQRCELLAAHPVRTLPESGQGIDAMRCTFLVDAALPEGLTVLPVAATPPRPGPKALAGRELTRAREHALTLGGPTLRWRRSQGLSLEHPAFERPALGVARLEDLADRGDLYDFGPLPGERPRIFDPCHLAPTRMVSGELFQELTLEGVLRLPPALTADRSARVARRVPLPVSLRVQVRKGEPFARLTVELTNTVRDHRLRILLPFPGFARRVVAGMPFFPQERPAHTPPDQRAAVHRDGQPAGDTHPFHGFVDVSDGTKGLAVFARGLREYQVIHDQNQETLALTLVRAVGWLSREDLTTRPGGAGPHLPTPEAQCLRSFRFELAVFPHGEIADAEIAATAVRFLEPPFATQPGPAQPT